MEIVIAILAIVCAVVGIIGSVAPALPGPPLAWIGVLLMYLWGGTNGDGETMSLTILLVMLGVTVLVTVLDYIVPAWFTKTTGGSRYASRGAMVGLFLGMFIPLPVGMIVTSLVCCLPGLPLRLRHQAHRLRGDALVYSRVYLIGAGRGWFMLQQICNLPQYGNPLRRFRCASSMPIATLRTSSAHSRGRLASSADIPYCVLASS